MLEIKLKKLCLKNFKAMKDITIDFGKVTNISGENKLGKTTILDSFTYLLFDKDSKDRSKFELQPLDGNNKVMMKLETQVSGILEIGDKELHLKKILRSKALKKKGEVEPDFKGTETVYYLDDLPVKQWEYKEKIESILEERLFKLLSLPLYFSSNLNLEQRREVILSLNGDITAEKLVSFEPSLEPFVKLMRATDLDTFRKTLATRIKKLNEDKKQIPYRVDELNNSLKADLDFLGLDEKKQQLTAELSSLEKNIRDSSNLNEDFIKDKDMLYTVKAKLRQLQYNAEAETLQPLKELNSQLREINASIFNKEIELDRQKAASSNNENTISALEQELIVLRTNFSKVSIEKLEMKKEEFICPTCKRLFEEADQQAKKQEITSNFNESRAKKLDEINALGKAKKERQEALKAGNLVVKGKIQEGIAKLAKLTVEKEEKQKSINSFSGVVDLSLNQDYKALKLAEQELEQKLKVQEQGTEATSAKDKQEELKAKQNQLYSELHKVNSALAYKEQNVKTKARISELLEEDKQLAQQMAELESQQLLMEKYIRTKMELLEESINEKFSYVKFKLFKQLVNGTMEECCEALIQGVPFSNTNTAAQLNAGIDIINTLSKHYNVQAPIFIDNRESVNQILPCEAQVINLLVTKDQKLVVEAFEQNQDLDTTKGIKTATAYEQNFENNTAPKLSNSPAEALAEKAKPDLFINPKLYNAVNGPDF